MWATCMTRKDGRVELIAKGDHPDLTQYQPDVHVVPCTPDGNMLSFGVHEFTRNCPCHPRIETRDEIEIVVHTTRTQ